MCDRQEQGWGGPELPSACAEQGHGPRAPGPQRCRAGAPAGLGPARPLRALSSPSPGSDSTTGMCGECQHTALENGKKTAKGKHYLGLFFFCGKLVKNVLIREGSRATTKFVVFTVFMLCIVLG